MGDYSEVPTIYSANDMLGFDPMSVPDFIAGLIFGFTGDNQLPEIEACYTGGEDIVTDAQNLINDLKAGEFLKAIDDNAKFADALSSALHSCEGMDDDFRRIKEWGEIFTEPEKLAETVGKHWLLHKRGIKKDIAKEQEDWGNALYYDAGKDTADALVKLIGEVPE